jgi:hypothetical protein
MIDNISPTLAFHMQQTRRFSSLARIAIVLALALGSLAGCAVLMLSGVDSRAQGEKSLTMTLVRSDGTINSTFQSPLQLDAMFAMIPGGLGGAPLEKDQMLVPASFGKPFRVDLDALQRSARAHATPPSVEFFEQGFTVSPPQTRLLRVGTFMFDAEKKRILAGGAINDADLKSGYLLMYFDRACKVEGQTQTGGVERNVEINIDFPGLHWLREHEVAAGKRVIEADDGHAAVVFRVQEPR